MLGKSQAPEKPIAAKVTVERGDAKANGAKIAKAKAGVSDKSMADKMDARDVTNAALRDARIECLSALPKRKAASVAAREE